MDAHKIVHDFGIDPLKRIRIFAARSRRKKSSLTEALPRSELVVFPICNMDTQTALVPDKLKRQVRSA
jgi:hypothetical protein